MNEPHLEASIGPGSRCDGLSGSAQGVLEPPATDRCSKTAVDAQVRRAPHGRSAMPARCLVAPLLRLIQLALPRLAGALTGGWACLDPKTCPELVGGSGSSSEAELLTSTRVRLGPIAGARMAHC